MTNALWYRNWIDTRWRFLVGLILLAFAAVSTVLAYPSVVEMLPLATTLNPDTLLGRAITDEIALNSTYRGYIWSQMYRQQLIELIVLFAALLGIMNPVTPSSGRGTLFLLSLPVSRARLYYTRAITGLLELLLLVMVPAVLLTMASPAIAQNYSIIDALAHGLCMFVAATVLFGVAAFLSTVFDDLWRPLLITCLLAAVLAMTSSLQGKFSLARVMSGETYFYSGVMPWIGLAICIVLSASVIYAGARILERRDF
jgi:hypothetical protein